MEKTKFWEESPGVQSHKRLITIVFALASLLFSGYILVATGDHQAALAVFVGMSGTAIGIMIGGKWQENTRAKINKDNG